MPIPTLQVGSLPRPRYLQEAIMACDAGDVPLDKVHEEQEKACKDTINRMVMTGSTIITDGEQRASSFAHYPFLDTLGGIGMPSYLDPNGQLFAIFLDGHSRRLPRLLRGPFRYRVYAYELLQRSIPLSPKPMKQAVIAPSMMSLLYPIHKAIEDYSREQFLDDIVSECEKDIRGCFEVGAELVQMDFTEGRLAFKNDPRNPWTGMGLLPEFIALNNRVLDRFTVEERTRIGVHSCPGADCDSDHSAEVEYEQLIPWIFQMNAGFFLIQMSSEANKERVYEACGKYSRDDQVVYIGVTNPLNPRVESPSEIAADLVLASRYIPATRLGATDDCGFSPFSTDMKPNHGGPDVARHVAFMKIRNRVQGAKLASEQLGI